MLVVLGFFIFRIIAPAVFAVAVVVIAVLVGVCALSLHALGKFFLMQFRRPHHRQDIRDIFPCGVQNVLHPLLALTAVVDEHVCLADTDDIQRRGLKAVCLPPGGHQQLYVHRVPADLPHKVVVGEQRAHHVQFPALRTVLPPAARQRQRQYRRQHRCACSSHVSRLLCVSCLIKS